MTNLQKNEIADLMELEADNLGSRNKLATKLDVSSATVSQIINRKWELIKDEMFIKIASTLNYDFGGWQIAEIGNYKQLKQVFTSAKSKSMFIPVSNRAGSGKTAAVKEFVKQFRGQNVYSIQCREWAKREFLKELCSTLGIETPRGIVSIDMLGQLVINFFEKRTGLKPLLIIDEADKLKAPALRFLIPLFNALEDHLGVVILGTENLKNEIKKGVRLNRKGYDEIDSRFGRSFIELYGATKNDIVKICKANGLDDRKTHTDIFKECEPTVKVVSTDNKKTQITVVEDLRRVKRLVTRELIKLNTAS